MLRQTIMCGAAALVFGGAATGQVAKETLGVGNGCYPTADDESVVCEPNSVIMRPITVVGLSQPVDVADLTSSVSVLYSDDLAVRQSPNPADQLRAVPGIGVSRSGSKGGLTQIRMRGAEANHTLVLVNGVEVSDPTTGETDFGLLTGLGATNIEVLRGEASSIYGSDAIGGVISISTFGDDGLSAMAEIGTQETFRGGAAFQARAGEGNIGLAVNGFSTAGVDSSGQSGEKDGSDAYSGMIYGEQEIGDEWSISGLANFRSSSADTDPDLDFDGRLDNADRVSESEQFLIGAALNGQTGAVEHTFRANFNSVTRQNNADGAQTDETTGERFKMAWSPSFEWGDQSLTGLVDYESEDYQRVGQASFFGDPNQSQSFETIGLAAEYRASFDDLDVSASARHDDNDGRFDNATTFRLGAGYSFESVEGRVRASVGTGVKNPTFTELFGFFPGQFVGNPNLEPEQSTGWDIGWDQSLGAFEYTLTYFSAELDNEIFTAFNPDFTSTAQNRAGESERSGVEVGARWAISEALELNGQATFIDSENDTGEDEIRVPSTTASIGLNWRPSVEGARFGVALDYVGEQDDFDFGAFPARRVRLDAYTLVSASAEYPLSDRVSLTLRGENLLDQDAVDVFGYTAPGAAAFIGLRLR